MRTLTENRSPERGPQGEGADRDWGWGAEPPDLDEMGYVGTALQYNDPAFQESNIPSSMQSVVPTISAAVSGTRIQPVRLHQLTMRDALADPSNVDVDVCACVGGSVGGLVCQGHDHLGRTAHHHLRQERCLGSGAVRGLGGAVAQLGSGCRDLDPLARGTRCSACWVIAFRRGIKGGPARAVGTDRGCLRRLAEQLPSYCKPQYKYNVVNAKTISVLDGVEWTETKDHSKVRTAASALRPPPCGADFG